MEKKTLVIAIVIGTIVITTLLTTFMHGRELSVSARRGLWAAVIAGSVALVGMLVFVLTK